VIPIIPDLTDIISPELRKKLYAIWAVGSALLAVGSVTLATGGIVNPLWLLMFNAAWNLGGSALGFVAKDNVTHTDEDK
jgi:hypothetical protein